MGVAVPEMPVEMLRTFDRGPLEALAAAIAKTGDLSLFTLESIKKMAMGLISSKNLSGPITIAKVASASAKSGLESYISFLALLSVSLGVLNLLPIPVLDGGHLLYYTLELLAGRPIPEKIQALGYQIGLFLVVGIMALALFNDFSRL
jgi:regulator of sigma E protease